MAGTNETAASRIRIAVGLLILATFACTTDRVPQSLARQYAIDRVLTSARMDIREGKPGEYDLEDATILRDRITSDADPDRVLVFLDGFVTRRLVEQTTRDLERDITALRTSPIVFDNGTLSLNAVTAHLAHEPAPNRRRRIAEAVLPILAELEPLFEERDRRIAQRAKDLGFPHELALAKVVRGYDVRDVANMAHALLKASDGMYLESLRDLALDDDDVPFEELRRPDIPWLLRPTVKPQIDQVLAAAHATLLLLKVDLPSANGFQLAEQAHPWALPLSPKALHDMGHSLHQSHSRVIFELRHLGDRSIGEAFAILMEGLASNPTWLKEQLRIKEPRLTHHLRRSAVTELLTVRLHAARVLFELERRGQNHEGAKQLYASLMSRALGVPFDPGDAARHLNDRDPFVDAADSLRGHIMAAQVRGALVERFGDSWWQFPAAGDFLEELWMTGQRDHAEELMARLEEPANQTSPRDGLDHEPLLRWIALRLIRQVPVTTLPL